MYHEQEDISGGDVNRLPADCVRNEKTDPGENRQYSPLAISPSLPDRGIRLRFIATPVCKTRIGVVV